jgi:hypothetical protein
VERLLRLAQQTLAADTGPSGGSDSATGSGWDSGTGIDSDSGIDSMEVEGMDLYQVSAGTHTPTPCPNALPPPPRPL